MHGTCAVHRRPGFYCFLLFPIVSRCTSAVHRYLTFHTGRDGQAACGIRLQPRSYLFVLYTTPCVNTAFGNRICAQIFCDGISAAQFFRVETNILCTLKELCSLLVWSVTTKANQDARDAVHARYAGSISAFKIF